MKLSIIIPIYNAQLYLNKCIETVAACPASDMECILVNDGSTDSSLELCKAYARKDKRFHILNKENEGVSIARNLGISHASGDYICFLDADDYIDIRKWSLILEAIEENYDFVAFSYYTLYENEDIKEERFPFIEHETTEVQTAKKLLIASASLNTCWGKLMKRDLINTNGILFDKKLKTGEDAVFIMDYFTKAQTYLIRNESILYYRQHSKSAMHQIDMNLKLEDFQRVYEYRKKLAKMWKDSELQEDMYRQLFSVITNLYLTFSAVNSFKTTTRAYREAAKKAMIQEITSALPYKKLTPVYKKLEYILIKFKMFSCLTVYFKLKNRFA